MSDLDIETPLSSGATDQPNMPQSGEMPASGASPAPLESLMSNAAGDKIGYDPAQKTWVDAVTRKPYVAQHELSAHPALPPQKLTAADMVKNPQTGQMLAWDQTQRQYVDVVTRRPYMAPKTPASPASPQPGTGEQVAQGFGGAAATTLAGLGKIGSNIPGVPQVANAVGDVLGLPKLNPAGPNANPYETVQKSTEQAAGQAQNTFAGKAGGTLENIAEFMTGEETLKGLSEVERLRKLMPVMKMFEDSPKLLAAAKAAMSAGKVGTVMGAQELAHGGTAEQAGEQAAIGTGLGVVGSALWGAGKYGYNALKAAGYSGAALDAVTKIASESAKPAEEIADNLQRKLTNTDAVMHTSFDNALENMRGKIGTEPVKISGSPLHDAAVSLQQDMTHLPEGIQSGIKGLVPSEGNISNLLESITNGKTLEMTGDQLIDLRQQLSKQLPRVAPALKEGVGKILEGIDGTLDKMAGEAGNVEGVSADYAQARGAYKQTVNDLKDSFIQRIRNGKISDVLEAGTKGQIAPHNIDVLKRLVGDDTVAGLGVNRFADIIKDATDADGNMSIKKAIQGWDKLSDGVKSSMFSATPEVGEHLDQLMDGLRTMQKVQTAVKLGAGFAAMGLGAQAAAHGFQGAASAIETIAAVGMLAGFGRFGGGQEFLEKMASNSKLWSGLGKLYGYSGENIVGRLGQAGEETAEQLAKRGPEGPAPATALQKAAGAVSNVDLGGEEGTAGKVTKRKAGQPGTPSLIGKRGVKAPEPNWAYRYQSKGAGDVMPGSSAQFTSDPEWAQKMAENNPLYPGRDVEVAKVDLNKLHPTDYESTTEQTPTTTEGKPATWTRVKRPIGQNEMEIHSSHPFEAKAPEAGRTEGVPVLPTEKVGGTRISQRKPTAVNAPENSVSEDLNLGMDAIKKADAAKPGFINKLAQTVAKYPGFPMSEDLAKVDPEKTLTQFVDHVSNNLQWLHNQIPENIRNISKLWYDSAHALTKQWAEKYGVSHEQMAGAVAALSPQNEWNNNVEVANRVADILKNKQNFAWSPEMQTKASQLAERSPDLGKVMPDIMGKSLKDLDNSYDKAAWVRVYDEAHNGRTMPNYAPDGSIRGLARNPVSNKPTVSHWNSTSGIAKAVSILEDGSKENLDKQLGDMHKIRNFYNNIIDPWSKSGDVTIDTHAVGAGHIRPMGGSTEEVLHNFGGGGAPSNSVHGVNGTYGLYAEAYRQAAAKLGILPRELQSITWEGIRSLYESRAKTPELKSQIAQIWKDHKNGEIPIDRARKQILKAAGGFKNPKWLSDLGQNAPEGSPVD